MSGVSSHLARQWPERALLSCYPSMPIAKVEPFRLTRQLSGLNPVVDCTKPAYTQTTMLSFAFWRDYWVARHGLPASQDQPWSGVLDQRVGLKPQLRVSGVERITRSGTSSDAEKELSPLVAILGGHLQHPRKRMTTKEIS